MWRQTRLIARRFASRSFDQCSQRGTVVLGAALPAWQLLRLRSQRFDSIHFLAALLLLRGAHHKRYPIFGSRLLKRQNARSSQRRTRRWRRHGRSCHRAVAPASRARRESCRARRLHHQRDPERDVAHNIAGPTRDLGGLRPPGERLDAAAAEFDAAAVGETSTHLLVR